MYQEFMAIKQTSESELESELESRQQNLLVDGHFQSHRSSNEAKD